MKYKLSLLITTVCLLLPARILPAASIDDDLKKITTIEAEIRKKSVALLSVIKRMGPSEEVVEEYTTVESVKLITGECNVYESTDQSSRVLLAPGINDQFELLEREDEFYRIRLQDGRDGWIPASCVQVFAEDRKVEGLSFEGLDRGEIKKYMQVAEQLYGMIEELKIRADRIASGYIDQSGKPPGVSSPDKWEDMIASYKKIQKYTGYATFFYNKYIHGYTPPPGEERRLEYRFSGWGEILLGSSDFTTKRENQKNITEDGRTSNVAFGGNLTVNETSRVRFGFSSRREIMQTPFRSTDLNAAYSYRPSEGMGILTRVRYHKYSDKINELNDYGRLSLGARADLVNTDNRSVFIDYTLMNNNYSESDSDDYTSNRIRGEARFKSGQGSDYLLRLDSNFETSDASFHKFVHLVPSFSYIRHRGEGKFRFTGSYEMLNYQDAGLKSYNKATMGIASSSFAGGKRKLKSLGLFYKQFPDNEVSTYLQARGRYSLSRTGVTSKRVSAAFYTSIFPENNESSFTDLRLDAGGSSTGLYGNISTFFKFRHSPGEDTDSTAVRPHVLDVYGKFGVIIKNLRIGPTFGLHTLVSKGEKFLKRDGNLFRYGGSAEGRFILPHRINLTLAFLYEYGHVYNSEIESVDEFGNVIYGETMERHPTTFQLNASLQVPITSSLELSARAKTYQIKTDMNEEISRDPVTENTRFTMFAGLRYRFN